jgi:cobalamin biosynthesis protein CobC
MSGEKRDHGGNLDAARRAWGGERDDWIDLSTGINPIPYPVPALNAELWTALPDDTALTRLVAAAKRFWKIPNGLSLIAAPGASALIAALPGLREPGRVAIDSPTYNEHAGSFLAHGWDIVSPEDSAEARVIVHPNNPDGKVFQGEALDRYQIVIIDESFVDPKPELTLSALAHHRGVIILKSFGKFWGLAGLRLGFAIGHPDTLEAIRARVGPWSVSGPALEIGTCALRDQVWAQQTRERLFADADRLDQLVLHSGRAHLVGGSPLFRLYETSNAEAAQNAFANRKIWTRRFPYSDKWLRLGLPGSPDAWERVAEAVQDLP